MVSQWEIRLNRLDPRRIKISLEIGAGLRVPFWYGRAYVLFDRDAAVYYPMPLHWIVGWVREGFYLLKFYKHTGRFERLLRITYMSGFEQGRVAGSLKAMSHIDDLIRAFFEGWERDLVFGGTTPLIGQPKVESIEVSGGQSGNRIAGPGPSPEGTPSS